MKKFRKTDKDLLVLVGTDIPPMSTKEYFIYAKFADTSHREILHIREIAEDFTYNKNDLFDKLSYMSKRKIIKKINKYHYQIIPKMSFNECLEGRVYPNPTKKERYKLIKEFS